MFSCSSYCRSLLVFLKKKDYVGQPCQPCDPWTWTTRELQSVTPPNLRATIGQGTVWLHPHPLWTMFVEGQSQFVDPLRGRSAVQFFIWFTVGTERTFSPAGLFTLSSWSPQTRDMNKRESSVCVFSTLRTAVIPRFFAQTVKLRDTKTFLSGRFHT